MAYLTLTDADFDKTIAESELPILVDFWAPWCGPCRFVGPVVEQIAEEHSDSLKVAKVNVDDNQAVAQKFGITSIPTLMLFKNGEMVDRIVGALPKQALELQLKKNIDW